MPFAIAAAIPVIEKIIEKIFPKPDDNKKKTAQASLKGEKNTSGAALKSVGAELTIISTMLEHCLPAEDGMVMIKAVLDSNEAGELLTHNDLRTIGRGWKTVTQQLSKIEKEKVEEISDPSTQRTFLDIINADTAGPTQSIADSGDADLATRKRAQRDLATSMTELHDALIKVNKIAETVVGEIASELTKASLAQKGEDHPAPTHE